MNAQALIETPAAVKRAISLLWASALLVIAFLVAAFVGLVRLPGAAGITTADVVTNLLTFGLLALLAHNLAKRRNWARWVLVAIACFGAIAGIFSMIVTPDLWKSASLAHYLFALLQTLLQVFAMALVFTASARKWFAKSAAI